ncbi:MAG: HAMP domain-containing histidine kinase [Spirochaetales bacterium]|nr:HAMP domain-containing histidine kinase [Spirochaetales bacterium]
MIESNMNAVRYQMQRRVALSSFIAIASIAVLDVIVGLAVRKLSLVEVLIHPSILVLLALASLCLVTSLKDWKVFRIIHVTCFLCYPLAVIFVFDESPYDMSFLTWSIYGIILCIQYRLLHKRLLHFIVAYILIFLLIRVVESAQYSEFTFHAAIGAGILLSLFVYLFWVVFAEELREYMRANDMLQDERNKNLIFVKFGKNIAGVVHNMKSVMMSFSGYSELIDTNNPASIERILDLQKRASTQMLNMINNFMTAVRSYQRSELSVVHVNELVSSAVEIFRGNQMFRNRNKIHFDLNEPDIIEAKPMEIMQIIDNLTKNAAESMLDNGKYDLFIRTGSDNGYVFLQVEDEGIGIDSCAACEKHNCMSCKEFAIGKSNKPDGTGIGLVYVREILKELNGSMNMESLIDHGTKVTLYFPAKVDGNGGV